MDIIISNDSIRETYNYLATIENVINKEIRQVKGNKAYIDKIVPANLVGIYSPKEKKALEFTDNLSRATYEASVVALVASFRKDIIRKIQNHHMAS